jgi:DNA-binding NtrC family response regulator
LREEGFEVTACRDGSAALKALRQTEFDAVITDLRMPGIPGMQLIDHARLLAPKAMTMVITAFGEVETAVEAMRKGVHDYICKPLILDEVIFKLKRLLLQRDQGGGAGPRVQWTVGTATIIASDEGGHAVVAHPLPDGTAYFDSNLKSAVRDFERLHINRILDHVQGNKAEAAQQLGIGLSSLYRKLEELGIDKHCGNGHDILSVETQGLRDSTC